jgi:hypothetical protein
MSGFATDTLRTGRKSRERALKRSGGKQWTARMGGCLCMQRAGPTSHTPRVLPARSYRSDLGPCVVQPQTRAHSPRTPNPENGNPNPENRNPNPERGCVMRVDACMVGQMAVINDLGVLTAHQVPVTGLSAER